MSHPSDAAGATIRNMLFLISTAILSVFLNIGLLSYIVIDKFF